MITVVQTFLNRLSLVSATLIVSIVIFLACYDWKTVNRVNFRLQAGIALTDIIRHTLQCFIEIPHSSLCKIIGLLTNLFDLIYTISNVMIVLNMQLMLINNIYPNPKWEFYYWVMPIILASILTFPLYDVYGASPIGLCYFKANFNETILVTAQVIPSVLIIMLSMLYCLSVPIIILSRIYFGNKFFYKLKKHVTKLNPICGEIFDKIFAIIILKNMMYPLAFVLSMIGVVVHVPLVGLFNIYYPKLGNFTTITRRLTGFFNLVAFSFDPSLHKALKRHYTRFNNPDINIETALPPSEDIELEATYEIQVSPMTTAVHREWASNELKALLMRFL